MLKTKVSDDKKSNSKKIYTVGPNEDKDSNSENDIKEE